MPDPIPSPQASTRRRFLRIARLLGAFAAVVGVIAALLVSRGLPEFRIHMLVATALGAGLTVFVGGMLMTLVFLSASSGHDEAAGKTHQSESDSE